jgi:hypothetical protein
MPAIGVMAPSYTRVAPRTSLSLPNSSHAHESMGSAHPYSCVAYSAQLLSTPRDGPAAPTFAAPQRRDSRDTGRGYTSQRRPLTHLARRRDRAARWPARHVPIGSLRRKPLNDALPRTVDANPEKLDSPLAVSDPRATAHASFRKSGFCRRDSATSGPPSPTGSLVVGPTMTNGRA